MTLSNSEVKLYNDILIAEIILSDNHGLSKTAQDGFASQFISKVHGYFSNNIDPENKTNSMLNMIAPGAISIAFRALGLGWLGFLIGIAMRVFHIDVASIVESIYTSLKSEVSGGKQMTSAQVDTIVNGAVETHTKPATQEEAENAAKTYKLQTQTSLKDAKMVKLAMIEFAQVERGIIKQSGILDIFSSQKTKTASVLSRILSLFFKIALASAGIMVAGDVINKLLGRPNALDNTIQHGKPVAEQAVPSVISRQTKFKVSPSYHDTPRGSNWVENVPNTKEGIQDVLVRFTKEVYPDTASMDGVIRGTAGFQAIADNILWHNHTSAGGPIVFIPAMFGSKKMLVDHFIDDVAGKAP